MAGVRDRAHVAASLAAALMMVLALGCRHEAPGDVEVRVRNVGFDYDAGAPVVILQAREDETRILPIWIGPAEAEAIAIEMQHVRPPRPLTHDLVKRIMDTTGVALRRVRITDLQGQTFFASLVLERDRREIEIDSRPSDAIALALRCRSPIFVERALFERGASGGPSPKQDVTAKLWGLTVQDVTPALAETLGLGAPSGVLVSDVGDEARAGVGVRRGDVIVAVDGKPIEDLAGLRALEASATEPSRVDVRRGGERMTLAFPERRAPHAAD